MPEHIAADYPYLRLWETKRATWAELHSDAWSIEDFQTANELLDYMAELERPPPTPKRP